MNPRRRGLDLVYTLHRGHFLASNPFVAATDSKAVAAFASGPYTDISDMIDIFECLWMKSMERQLEIASSLRLLDCNGDEIPDIGKAFC